MARKRRDRFSELPLDLLDKILGCMPILRAARLAVLSTLWRDAWFSLTTLDFNEDFSHHIKDKYYAYYAHSDRRTQRAIYHNTNVDILVSMSLSIINKVLMHHKGPIHKFCFGVQNYERDSLGSQVLDIYQWLTFVTQKGVEEIHLNFDKDDGFLLPNCIFSCQTLRKLRLYGSTYDTSSAPCMLPNFTSLYFDYVDFEDSSHTINAPMLENLSFVSCYETLFHFNVTAPKLSTLAIQGCSFHQTIGNLPIKYSTWESVRTLLLDGYSIEKFFGPLITRGLPLYPSQLPNVEYLMVLEAPLECDDATLYPVESDISLTFIHVLQLFPSLCKLRIDVSLFERMGSCLDRQSKLPEELLRVAQTLNLLHTLILSDAFMWNETNLLPGIKGFLACFPTLKKFVIGREFNLKTIKEILHFPRASPKVEIMFI
ncbi:unnamed protein product [Cuscuta epithymum]|uniref:F-box domain-containing protein n=1 Tax=Cuscuta epithymum TaxID=186058 RepID=A0AAV0EIS9_9ASTE|nr:unnamed protein product [Cuscuta epithymum]CAH9124075.1 unnamed protein product [Cuscuta epithymum]